MSEAQITDKIKSYLKGVKDLFYFKEHGGQFGTAGVPDIICCYRQRFVAFEVKTDKGKTTLLQEIALRKIRQAGGIAKVVRSVDEVKAVIAALEKL